MILFASTAALLGAHGPVPIVLDAVSDLIAQGKQELVRGQAAEALATFTRAHAASNGKLETELWVLRGRLATGDLAAFDRVVEIEAGGHESDDMSYVLGAGRYAFAKAEQAKPKGDPGGAFEEAAAYLEEATTAAPDGYPDAWRMMAESARWVGNSELAAQAVGRALEFAQDADLLTLASKIRVARGTELMASEDTKAAGERSIREGIKDAEAAIAARGDDKQQASALADLYLQIAVGQLYLTDREAAANAYVEAMGWDPSQPDYGTIMNSLRDAETGDKPFIAALTKASARVEERWGKSTNSDAGLQWWLGYARYYAGAYKDAVDAFEKAVEKFPAYASSHWYIGMSHYQQGESSFMEAVDAWRTLARVNQAEWVRIVGSDPRNVGAIGFVIGKFWNERGSPTNELAHELAELVLLTDMNKADNWNNVALMARDAGSYVRQAKVKEPRQSAEQYFERALEAYARAAKLDRRPQYLNDGAVILHYYLERDYDDALALYDEAEALAASIIESGKFAEGEEEVVRIALRDARNNRAALKKKIAKESKAPSPAAR